MVIADKSVFTFDCTNKTELQVPLSKDLETLGWVCKLDPRKVINDSAEYAQGVVCMNKAGVIAAGYAHCAINDLAIDDASLVVDQADAKVKGTSFNIRCITFEGESI